MPTASEGLRVRPGVVIPERELRWRFSRSSGPGGQGVNTSDSRVELSWDAATSAALTPLQRERALDRLGARAVRGVVTVAASEHRAQLRNREAARIRLADLIGEALSPPGPKRRPTRATLGAQRRRLESKRQRAGIKRMRQRPRQSE